MAMSDPAAAPRRRGRPSGSARAADTRDLAIEAARRLLLTGGDAALSMEGLARALALRAPSLYHHFPGGRDEMILAVADQCSRLDGEAIEAIVRGPGRTAERLAAVARHFAAEAGHHPYHMLTELRKGLPQAARAQLQQIFADRVEAPLVALVREGQAAGELRALDPELVVRAFLTLMLSLGEFEADDPQRATLPGFLVDLLDQGLAARPAAPASRPAAGGA